MRHKQDASNMVMPDKQSESGRIFPKIIPKNCNFYHEISVSSDYIPI